MGSGVQNHGQRAVEHRIVAQGGFFQFHGGANGGHAVAVNLGQNLFQENIAHGFDDAAVDHGVGADGVDHVAGRDGQVMARAVNGFHGDRVLLLQGAFEGLALEGGAVQRVGHEALPSAGHLLADVGGHALLAGEGFQASTLTADRKSVV